jgi:hypothetical protein
MYLHTNNFLSKEEIEFVKEKLLSIPFRFRHSIEGARDGVVGLTNENYSDSGVMLIEPLDEEIVKFLINKFAEKNNVKIKKILRARANLNFKSNDTRPLDPHVDLRRKIKNYNFVYYANDSDGYTTLFSQKYTGEPVDPDKLEVFKSFKPQAGYALFFDGDIFHNWENPKNFNYRLSVVVNIDCEVDESVMEQVPF